MKSSTPASIYHFVRQHSLAAMVVLACIFAPAKVSADEVPWRQRAFDLQASNEPLSSFLLRVLTFDGISATMSPTVGSGRVNGRFRGKTEKVFKELADTYGLTWYYDGQTLHVYSIAEIETRLLQVDPVDVPRIDRTLKQMRLSDARFPLRIANSEGQVLVSGPPRYVELVEQVVGRVADSPSRPKAGIEVRVFRLRHARAADTLVTIGGIETRVAGVASTLNALLNDARREPPPESTVRSTPRSARGLRGQGLAAVGNPVPINPLTTTPNGANVGGASTTPSAAATPAGAPASPFASSTSAGPGGKDAAPYSRDGVARADERLNAVIIRDVNERMPMYTQLINSLDVETALVEIEATVIDVSEDKSEQLGIDWRLRSKNVDILSSPNDLAGNGSNPRSVANDLLYAGSPASLGKGLVGTLLFGNERNFFLSRLNLLAETGDARLISRPRILTTENIEAVLQSTKEFYVRVAGRDQVDLFNVSLGMLMRVTPSMVEDEQGRRFKLQVRIEDGNTNSGQQVDQIPVVNRNAIATQAVVGEGQSLLIGGYVIEERNNTKQGVPGLSDVPVLGWLFGQRGNAVRRSERMFLITPRLIKLNGPSVAAPPDAPTLTIPPTVFPRPRLSFVPETEP
jgi:type III secretion protein C